VPRLYPDPRVLKFVCYGVLEWNLCSIELLFATKEAIYARKRILYCTFLIIGFWKYCLHKSLADKRVSPVCGNQELPHRIFPRLSPTTILKDQYAKLRRAQTESSLRSETI
jgi:hypothetical protein